MTGESVVAFDFAPAAAELLRVASGVRDEQLDGPTPCTEWSVRDLLAHVCGLAAGFTATARKQSTGGQAGQAPRLPAAWRTRLPSDLDTLVTAWREPGAWQGESEAGGVTMPAADLAAVAIDELTVHAWDLAVSTDQRFRPTAEAVAISTGFAAAMSTPETVESRGGLFGPVVDHARDAGGLGRLLALAGRDATWRAGAAHRAGGS